MPRIKLILSDIDSTIMPRGAARVSDRTLAAFHTALEAGLVIGPASGRGFAQIAPFFAGDTACFATCIATNGLAAMQAGRLRELAPLFERVFVSEEMGVIKPDPAFFAHMLKALNATADRCLMIGDSLASDIAGACAAGLDSIWFNRRGAPLPAGIRVKAVIRDLRELLSIL